MLTEVADAAWPPVCAAILSPTAGSCQSNLEQARAR